MHPQWPVQLFKRSVLKQRKYEAVTTLLGPTAELDCLDIGSDNGVISYLLRQRGGRWKSADLDAPSVAAIRELVGDEVYLIKSLPLPFQTDEFDRVALVDCLEHIHNDVAFIQDLHRITRPDGRVIINVPHHRPGFAPRLRHALGQTDEKHGHVRPGYTIASLRILLGDDFTLERVATYSKFFSELIDMLIVYVVSRLIRGKGEAATKGLLVTSTDLRANQTMFRVYSMLYPLVWSISKLDSLLFFTSGYMLIATARVNKQLTAAGMEQPDDTSVMVY